ncbi:MAG TPA: hypothetical protein VLT47_10950 [Anaeromyxobacteraceae bacterium]|nr:hypothetical protein [Anaeromyxobacteraceae bacterium]
MGRYVKALDIIREAASEIAVMVESSGGLGGTTVSDLVRNPNVVDLAMLRGRVSVYEDEIGEYDTEVLLVRETEAAIRRFEAKR